MTHAAMKKVLTVIALLGAHPVVGHAQAEGFTITGTVVDKSTGNPLQDAVVVLGEDSWSVSDESGVFTLPKAKDGMRAPGFDINSLPPDAVEALEVYQGPNVPFAYSHSCGAVLIWMRRSSQGEFRNRNQP